MLNYNNIFKRLNQPFFLQGWLAKVKHGHARKVWCLLIGKIFVYFKTPNDPNPLGQVTML